MLLPPDSSVTRQDVETNRDSADGPDASPPMETAGRRRGSNSRLPSLATLVSK